VKWLRERRANGSRMLEYGVADNGKSLICQGLKVDIIATLTREPLQASDLTHGTLAAADQEPSYHLRLAIDATVTSALASTLLIDHPGRAKRDGSTILGIPWHRYQEGWDFDWDSWHGPSWREFWEKVDLTGFYNAFDKFRKANSSFLVGGHELKDCFPEFLPNSSDFVPNDLRICVVSLVGRRPCTTAEVRLGLVPEEAQEGDVIAILRCSFPVLLSQMGIAIDTSVNLRARNHGRGVR